MINLQTLLSAFDEKGTLLKWLKKVEAALTNATLESVQVVVVDETHIKMKFVFADGTSVESPSITLPRGPQGPTGATGSTGATGATGATPNISVTATQLPADAQPTATRSGTDENPIITFGIPSGATQLYLHEFTYTPSDYEIKFSIYSHVSDSLSPDLLNELLINVNGGHHTIIGTVLHIATDRRYLMYDIQAENYPTTNLVFSYINGEGLTSVITIDVENPPANGDIVTPL